MGRSKPRVVVIGAGPVGLEAALVARRLGWPTRVFEMADAPAAAVRGWAHLTLFTPFGHLRTPQGVAAIRAQTPGHPLPEPGDAVTGQRMLEAYWLPLGTLELLKPVLSLQTRVLLVGRSGLLRDDPIDARRSAAPFRLLVQGPDNVQRSEEADIVLDCSGVLSHPNWLGDGGIPAAGEIAARPQFVHGTPDILGSARKRFAGRAVLLVGGGPSAATNAVALAELAESEPATWVTWAARGSRTAPLPRVPGDPLRDRDKLAVRANALATRRDGNLEFHAGTRIDTIQSHGPDKGFTVTATAGGDRVTWDVEQILANAGYRGNEELSRELRVGVARPPEWTTDEPGFFRLGAKSFGRDGGFLLREGFAQVRACFAKLLGKPDFDPATHPYPA